MGAPSVEIACAWPPYGIRTLYTWGLPLTNTFTLLASGASITWSHRALMLHRLAESRAALIITLELATIFTILQYTEYLASQFSINDAVYGSLFFMITGFHGLHVIIGTIFLFICYLRLCNCHFTARRHLGFEMAIWYWHFVDVVWIFVFYFYILVSLALFLDENKWNVLNVFIGLYINGESNPSMTSHNIFSPDIIISVFSIIYFLYYFSKSRLIYGLFTFHIQILIL